MEGITKHVVEPWLSGLGSSRVNTVVQKFKRPGDQQFEYEPILVVGKFSCHYSVQKEINSKTQNVVYKSNTTIMVDAKLLRPLKVEYSLKAKFCINIGTIPPQLLHFMTVM